MKKQVIYSIACSLLLSLNFVFNACVDEKEEALGGIYGIVTKEGTTDVMPAIMIELYLNGDKLLSTYTFSNGQYEFSDLKAGKYLLKIVAKGYEETEYSVVVEAGRKAQHDMQVKILNTHMSVRTMNATDQKGNSVTLNGYVSYDGSYRPIEAGFYYSATSDPLSGTQVKGELDASFNSFSAIINDLSFGTYYVIAYGENSKGISYGDIKTFSMTNYPVVRTDSATNILSETATLNGYIVSEGDPTYTERGFVYSKTYSTPTVDDPENVTIKVIVPGTNRNFSANVSSLSENASYYVRAYATHAKGTVYGEIITIVPKAILPEVVTLEASNILAESATINGRVDKTGEPPYTECGFIYTKSNINPTINDPSSITQKVVVPGTERIFSANITSLSTGTKYYVRAYAISPKGVSYGDSVSFVPAAIMPEVVTLPVSNILAESATLNGRIDNVGEPAYTERGFVYSKSYDNPTINDPSSATTKIMETGNGNEFSANINALTTGSDYFARAYAKSTKGVSYGSVVSFKPQSDQYVILEDSHLMVMKQDLASSATWSQAIKLCKTSTVGGFEDWRLPTLTESNILFMHKVEIGGFETNTNYWSSDCYEYSYEEWSNAIGGYIHYQYYYPYYYYFNGYGNQYNYDSAWARGISYNDYNNKMACRVRAVRTIP